MFMKVAFTSLYGDFSHKCFGNSHSNKLFIHLIIILCSNWHEKCTCVVSARNGIGKRKLGNMSSLFMGCLTTELRHYIHLKCWNCVLDDCVTYQRTQISLSTAV